MTVKDEVDTLEGCLEPILDLFQQYIIIDTGSTDGTQDLLRNSFGIEPIQMALQQDHCYSLAPSRNWGFEQLDTPWILTLDADERIARNEMQALVTLDDIQLSDGLFCAWITHFDGRPSIYDYKLSLFRNGFKMQGLEHATVQADLRLAGANAEWSDLFTIQHVPDGARLDAKHRRYSMLLEYACQHQPEWLRYHWFRGYMYFRQGMLDKAESYLRQLHDQRPELFPVESLNGSMVLAGIYAANNQKESTLTILHEALDFYQLVASDFEVRVNFRLCDWLETALGYATQGYLQNIKPYAFPY